MSLPYKPFGSRRVSTTTQHNTGQLWRLPQCYPPTPFPPHCPAEAGAGALLGGSSQQSEQQVEEISPVKMCCLLLHQPRGPALQSVLLTPCYMYLL